LKEKESNDTALDSLFSTYWGDNDNLLKEEDFSESPENGKQRSMNKDNGPKIPNKLVNSSLGSGRALIILEKAQSENQIKKSAKYSRIRIVGKAGRQQALKANEKSLKELALSDSHNQKEQ